MRALLVHPGPGFSVADVFNGWERGLIANGVDVQTVDLHSMLWFYSQAIIKSEDDYVQALSVEDRWWMTAEHIKARAFTWWPDVVFSVSGFFLTPHIMDLFRARNMKLVHVFTESPYEEDTQLERAQLGGDLVVLNDPTNLEKYRAAGVKAMYVPHSYDPQVHRPGPVHPDYESDVCVVGSGYPSRIAFLEQMDWSGIDLALCGNWMQLPEGHDLAQYVRGVTLPEGHADRYNVCIDNEETVRYYQSTHASVNLYRQEANRPDLSDGWSMGPREVELAATGTFFVSHARGENEEVLPMVPKVSDPGEASEVLRWYLDREDARAEVSRAARQAIDGWTFENRTAQVLRSLDR